MDITGIKNAVDEGSVWKDETLQRDDKLTTQHMYDTLTQSYIYPISLVVVTGILNIT